MQSAEDSWHISAEQQMQMRQHARALEIRLQGPKWDDMLKVRCGEEDGAESRETDSDSSSEAAKAVEAESESIDCDNIDGKLKDLFEDLPNFEKLDDLLLQVGPSHKHEFKGPWTQIYASAVEKLLASVPKMSKLHTLTIDLFAGFLDDTSATVHGDVGYHVGLCTRIAAILPLVPVVRLRLRHSCPAIFPTAGHLSVVGRDVRLRSLVIKLHVPYGESASAAFGGPFWCRWDKEAQSPQHYADMIRGARTFQHNLVSVRQLNEGEPAKQKSRARRTQVKEDRDDPTRGVERLRISWPGGSCIEMADVLSNRVLMPGEEFFVYEDCFGDSWDLEERTDLVDVGSVETRLKGG